MILGVPFHDLSRQTSLLRKEIDEALSRVISSGRFLLGRELEAFEAEFSAYIGVSEGVGVANGTDALELALRGVNIKAGSRVALAANAGNYGSTALDAIGAHPIYVDVEESSLNLCPIAFERCSDIQAVIVTHLYGRMASIEAIVEIASRKGISVIEDCAQAHGAALGGRKAGSWGDAACFSFYPTKNLGALGDAGMVVTSSSTVANRIRKLRQYGWGDKYKVMTPGGRNSRMDELHAAVLRTKLSRLDAWNERRRTIASRYNERLAALPLTLPAQFDASAVAHLYVIRAASRDAIRASLSAKGVQTDIHYPLPDYRQESRGGSIEDSLVVTDRVSEQILSLPCFPELSDEELDYVISALHDFHLTLR